MRLAVSDRRGEGNVHGRGGRAGPGEETGSAAARRLARLGVLIVVGDVSHPNGDVGRRLRGSPPIATFGLTIPNATPAQKARSAGRFALCGNPATVPRSLGRPVASVGSVLRLRVVGGVAVVQVQGVAGRVEEDRLVADAAVDHLGDEPDAFGLQVRTRRGDVVDPQGQR